jgi:hypothetical protein
MKKSLLAIVLLLLMHSLFAAFEPAGGEEKKRRAVVLTTTFLKSAEYLARVMISHKKIREYEVGDKYSGNCGIRG